MPSDESDADFAHYMESYFSADEVNDKCTDDHLWENLFLLCSSDNEAFESLECCISLFKKSKDDNLLNQIMDFIDITSDTSTVIEDVLKLYHKSIIDAIESDTDSIWSSMIREKKFCKWVSGNDYKNYKSLQIRVKHFIELFLGMQRDSLIQKIDSDIDELDGIGLSYERINKTVEKYKNAIKGKLQDAEKRLNEYV